MNKTLLKLSSVSLILLLLSTNSFAEDEKKKDIAKTEKSDGKRPVDDADKKKPKEDNIKGGDKVKDKEVNATIKLSSIKNHYTIKRSGLHYPPYRCFIYRNGKETDIGTSQETSFTFKVDKSLLNVGDEILITNRLDSVRPLPKEIIHDVEIVK